MSETDEYDFSGVVLGPVSSSSGSDPALVQEDTEDDEEDIEIFWSGSLPYDITEKLLEINRAFIDDETPIRSDRPRKVKFNNRVRVRDISMHRLNTDEDETDSTDAGEISDTAVVDPESNTKIPHKLSTSHSYNSVHEKAILTDSPRLFVQERQLRNTAIFNEENRKTGQVTSSAGKLQTTPIKSQSTSSTSPSSRFALETKSANEPARSINKSKNNSDFSDAQNSLCLENDYISKSASLSDYIDNHDLVESSDKSKLERIKPNLHASNNISELASHEIHREMSFDKCSSVYNENSFDEISSEYKNTQDKSDSCDTTLLRSSVNELEHSDSDSESVTNSEQPGDDTNSIEKSQYDHTDTNFSENADSNQSGLNLYDISSDNSDALDDHCTDLDRSDDDGAFSDTETMSEKCHPKLKQCTQSSQDSAICSIEDNASRVSKWCGQSTSGGCGDTSRHKPTPLSPATASRVRPDRVRFHYNHNQTSLIDTNNNNNKVSKQSGVESFSGRSCGACRNSSLSKSGGHPTTITGTACDLHHRSSYREFLQTRRNTGSSILPSKEGHDTLYLWRKRCRNLSGENGVNSASITRPATKEPAIEPHSKPRDSGAYQFWLRKKNQQHKLEKQITKLKQAPIGGRLASPGGDRFRGVSCERTEPHCDRSRGQIRQRPGLHRSLSHHLCESISNDPTTTDRTNTQAPVSSSEKRSQCDQVFQLWLQKKRDEQRLKNRIESLQQEILTANARARDPQRAYAEWLQVKKHAAGARPSSTHSSTMRGRANYLRAKDVYAPDVFSISQSRRASHRTR